MPPCWGLLGLVFSPFETQYALFMNPIWSWTVQSFQRATVDCKLAYAVNQKKFKKHNNIKKRREIFISIWKCDEDQNDGAIDAQNL